MTEDEGIPVLIEILKAWNRSLGITKDEFLETFKTAIAQGAEKAGVRAHELDLEVEAERGRREYEQGVDTLVAYYPNVIMAVSDQNMVAICSKECLLYDSKSLKSFYWSKIRKKWLPSQGQIFLEFLKKKRRQQVKIEFRDYEGYGQHRVWEIWKIVEQTGGIDDSPYRLSNSVSDNNQIIGVPIYTEDFYGVRFDFREAVKKGDLEAKLGITGVSSWLDQDRRRYLVINPDAVNDALLANLDVMEEEANLMIAQTVLVKPYYIDNNLQIIKLQPCDSVHLYKITQIHEPGPEKQE